MCVYVSVSVCVCVCYTGACFVHSLFKFSKNSENRLDILLLLIQSMHLYTACTTLATISCFPLYFAGFRDLEKTVVCLPAGDVCKEFLNALFHHAQMSLVVNGTYIRH